MCNITDVLETGAKEDQTKELYNSLAHWYSKLRFNLSTGPVLVPDSGPVYFITRYKQDIPIKIRNIITIIEVKSAVGEEWSELYTQASRYIYSVYITDSVFFNCMRGT